MEIRIAAALAAGVLAATAPGAAAAGGQAPSVAFTTRDRSVVVGAVDGVRGTARDDRRVVRVRVTYCGNGALHRDGGWTCGGLVTTVVETRAAALTCASGGRSCTWFAAAPVQPDNYLVFARATDAAGRGAGAGPILVTVV